MEQGNTSLRHESAGQTHVGQRRKLNEDAWRIAGDADAPELWAQRGKLFAVADGMGGHAAGEVASRLAIDTLFSRYYASDPGPLSSPFSIRRQLEQAIAAANQAVYEQAAENRAQTGMGTTLVAAVLHGDWLTIANVGDSRAYIWHNGAAEQVTRDHSWVAEQVQAGILSEEEARVHIYRSVVTRCIGHQPDVQIDLFERLLDPGDMMLLCSDGLSNQVSANTIAEILSRPPDQALEELIRQANDSGGPDNITAIIIQTHSAEAEPIAAPITALPPPDLARSHPPLPARQPAPAARRKYLVAWVIGGLALLLLLLIAVILLYPNWVQNRLFPPSTNRTPTPALTPAAPESTWTATAGPASSSRPTRPLSQRWQPERPSRPAKCADHKSPPGCHAAGPDRSQPG